ncbi:MAG: hypothetical protein Q9199_001370 [Rusavskia elegans]
MAGLGSRLSSCGLLQYHERLVDAGFDTWETILDITESDLEYLDVKRGHRRRLQQEIGHTLNLRGKNQSQPPKALHPSLKLDTKRQCTHQPKPDPNAPQRPQSGSVLFSNSVRADLKEQSPSFAEQSKIAGERWQDMSDAARDSWKQATSGAWDKYKADNPKYHDANPHRQYQEYLIEFNASQSSKKRKSKSNDLYHEVDEVQTHSNPHQAAALKRSAPNPDLASPGPATALPSASISERQKSLMPNSDGSYASVHSLQSSNPQRYGTACESCKKKKIKCDGGMPTCESCRKSNSGCFYAGGIRDKERRLLVNAVDKMGLWEQTLRRIQPKLGEDDQSEIRHLLRTSPQAEEAHSISCGSTSRTTPDESKEDSTDDPGGEDDASNVGSMGSTDHLNEEIFAGEHGTERIHSFLGQTASDTWVERIKHNLKLSDADEPRTGHDPTGDDSPRRQNKQVPTTTTDLNPTSPIRASMFQEHVEPYELPTKASADSFVDAYFATVHPVFPIVSRSHFLWNYEAFFASTENGRWSTSMFVPMLHIVLAIGAVHAYVTHAPWVRDERSRLLRFARAKATILDACILGASAYEQVQLCGLGGLYMLIMYDINKAWNLAGLGVRCAQALGLHLVNSTPDMTESQRNLRLGMWTSILSLERTVAIVTGRPSMVRDRDCTATLPPDGLIDPDKHHCQRSPSHATPAPVTSDSTSFLQYVELSSLADLVLAALYSAHIRHIKWSELQSTIRELDQKACKWNTKLSLSFETDPGRQGPEHDSARIAIGMFFHSTRVLINRPCLCRLDRRIDGQSDLSGSINAAAAHRCVTSARAILALIPNQPEPGIIYRGPLWWMGFHHLKRATTVLIQEITFQSESTSAAGADIVTDAIKAINWLHALGLSSSPAYSAWVTLSRLLLRAAQEFGGDVSGARIADDKEDPSLESGDTVAKGQSQEEVPASGSEMQHEGFPMTVREQGIGENTFSDLNSNAWDQLFGLGQESFFPTMSELDDFYGGNEGAGER